MKATLQKAFGYQGDNMNLPVRDLAAALPFYETVLGFRVLYPDGLCYWFGERQGARA
jgi:catechol 2,3-dioxygenase-like lactoylglutathione lyase family enzyme